MSAVADRFDRDGDGYIDYYEFVAALHPNKDAYKPLTDADKIEDEVMRLRILNVNWETCSGNCVWIECPLVSGYETSGQM